MDLSFSLIFHHGHNYGIMYFGVSNNSRAATELKQSCTEKNKTPLL